MTTEPQASAFSRAESSSRQIVLQIGLGVVAFVLGSIMSAGAAARIAERIGPIDSDVVAWTFHWLFERLWLFTLVPLFGYAAGRFTQVDPVRFTLLAALSGETFAVLLITGINGFDYLVEGWENVVARLVTLFIGMLLTVKAVQVGRAEAAESQVEATAVAERRKAEYATFLAAAEGKSAELPKAEAPATAEPAPSTPTDPTPGAGPSA